MYWFRRTDLTNPLSWARAWTYQTCTEFGFFQTSVGRDQPFSEMIDQEFYFQMCIELFGKVPDVESTNKRYGGLNFTTSNIVFTNGAKDPWSTLSVVEQRGEAIFSRIIQNAGHCRDLYAPHYSDSSNLKEIRSFILQTIRQWSTEPKHFDWIGLVYHIIPMLSVLLAVVLGCAITVVSIIVYRRWKKVDTPRIMYDPASNEFLIGRITELEDVSNQDP